MLIHNAIIVNERRSFRGFLTIVGERIAAVNQGDPTMEQIATATGVIDAQGGYVMPGVIDDQVHFRDPGMTDKGDIQTESRAAIAGGVTSFMEMPNTKPAAVTLELLERKYERAAAVSPANYSFYLGATNDNIDQIRSMDPQWICGVKIFMGSSTGNMLVDRRSALEAIFAESPTLIATHCEDESMVSANLRAAFEQYGDNIPLAMHPLIRSAEACYRSSAQAVELAEKYGAQLHILHLSTAREMSLFTTKPLEEKKITAEVCVHHLWFSDRDYERLGMFIKCNPAIKTLADRDALRQALQEGRIDVVATDHAPHTLAQKQSPYTQNPSGLPLVQHSLPMMLQLPFAVEQTVDYMCHRPAILFRIKDRGFLRAGYYADLTIVKQQPWVVTQENILYKCGWSPLENTALAHKVTHTIVNGHVAFENGEVKPELYARRLEFKKR